MSVKRIPELIKAIYSTVAQLEQLFPHRKFTPDGILVGSIGEVLAAHHYGLDLLPQNSPSHDARDTRGILVQIKTTQRDSIDIRTEPGHLLVLKLRPDGTCFEVYNGRGSRVWQHVTKKPMPRVGFYTVSLSQLARLSARVSEEEKIRRVQE